MQMTFWVSLQLSDRPFILSGYPAVSPLMKFDMQKFIEAGIRIVPWSAQTSEIIQAWLQLLYPVDILETNQGFIAYIPEDKFDKDIFNNQLDKWRSGTVKLFTTFKTVENINWNTEWEKNFSPTRIGNKVFVRAPFHKPDKTLPVDIIIQPEMSFGTGHHETTFLMAEALLETDLQGMSVLDMGCGTGILSIIAAKTGAGSVVAIDPDEWSFQSAKENFKRNKTSEIKLIKGNRKDIPQGYFDLILANINRNILIQDIPAYSQHLKPGDLLYLSGFLKNDKNTILSRAKDSNLGKVFVIEKGDWLLIALKKEID